MGGEAFTMNDVLLSVSHLGLVTTAGRSIARWFPLPGVGFADVDDLSPVVLAVAVRTGESRPIVRDFVEIVREIVRDLAETTPDLAVLSVA